MLVEGVVAIITVPSIVKPVSAYSPTYFWLRFGTTVERFHDVLPNGFVCQVVFSTFHAD